MNNKCFVALLFLCLIMASRLSAQKKYGNNILSLAPMHISNESKTGISLHYERNISKNHNISFVLPVAMVFPSKNNRNTNYEKVTGMMTYIYPGVKFYPTGNNKAVSYSIGVSGGFGFGTVPVFQQVPGTNTYEYRQVTGSRGGLLLNNGLNIQPTASLYIGIELGLGYNYYNTFYKSTFDDPFSNKPFAQFHIKFGYRF